MSDRLTEFAGVYGDEKMYIIKGDIRKLSKQDLINLLGQKEDEIKDILLKNTVLKASNDILKDSLRMACEYVEDEWDNTELGNKAKKVGGFYNYFIDQSGGIYE